MQVGLQSGASVAEECGHDELGLGRLSARDVETDFFPFGEVDLAAEIHSLVHMVVNLQTTALEPVTKRKFMPVAQQYKTQGQLGSEQEMPLADFAVDRVAHAEREVHVGRVAFPFLDLQAGVPKGPLGGSFGNLTREPRTDFLHLLDHFEEPAPADDFVVPHPILRYDYLNMKIVSVLVFAFALVGTWALVHNPRPVAQSVHIGIQNDLKNIIAEYVQKNLPESKNLRFEKFYTETLNKSRVRAVFAYSFEDKTEEGEPAAVQIEGEAILNKIDETPETVTWSFDQLTIQDNKVTFSDPIQITAGTGAAGGDTPPATPADPPKEEKHQ